MSEAISDINQNIKDSMVETVKNYEEIVDETMCYVKTYYNNLMAEKPETTL